MGPKMRKLVALHVARTAIPTGGSLADGVKFLSNPQRVAETAKASQDWIKQALSVLRQAAPPNPYAAMDDEALAEELLRRLEARKQNANRRNYELGAEK